MSGEWRQEPFSSAVLINPPVRLTRSCEYPFVSMDAIGPGSRWVYASRQRVYEGGGSRFQDGDTLLARITPYLDHQLATVDISFIHDACHLPMLENPHGLAQRVLSILQQN